MKKVLIISYFFEPANFVGAERINAWKKYLPNNEVYPIVLTRHWRENQTNLNKIEEFKTTQTIKSNDFEIHRVPERWGLRDELVKMNKFSYLRKALTFYQLICDILFFKKSQYYFLYTEAIKVINEHSDLDTLIISGTPFHSFAIGYYLKIKFPNLKWYPDYRDQWNTHEHLEKYSLFRRFLIIFEKKKERLWTSNSTKFITVSENWKNRIEKFIHKEGLLVKNGMDININSILPISIPKNEKKLCISYVGTLYPYQNINLLLNVIKKIKIEYNFEIKLNFVGINTLGNYERKILKEFPELREQILFVDRLPAKNLKIIYEQSDLLWLTSFDEMKGWYPVKLFDYAKQGLPILLFPSDNDVMEEFVDQCSVGFYFNGELEVFDFLISLLNGDKRVSLSINYSKMMEYSRENQTKILAQFFK